MCGLPSQAHTPRSSGLHAASLPYYYWLVLNLAYVFAMRVCLTALCLQKMLHQLSRPPEQASQGLGRGSVNLQEVDTRAELRH